jgi:hypothetical protein
MSESSPPRAPIVPTSVLQRFTLTNVTPSFAFAISDEGVQVYVPSSVVRAHDLQPADEGQAFFALSYESNKPDTNAFPRVAKPIYMERLHPTLAQARLSPSDSWESSPLALRAATALSKLDAVITELVNIRRELSRDPRP